MNHLEKLIRQFHEWRGYIVRGNVKVGRLDHGGWEGELDIVAYNPKNRHLIHLEPSLAAEKWDIRVERFGKKFALGREYIPTEVYPWLRRDTKIEQVAILVSGTGRKLEEGRVISIDDYLKEIKKKILQEGLMNQAAIPEEFDLLRTIQLTICGYGKRV